MEQLFEIYKGIDTPTCNGVKENLFSIESVPRQESYYVGKDGNSYPCFLIYSSNKYSHEAREIKLENLDIEFNVLCAIKNSKREIKKTSFTIIRCRTAESKTIHYFFSICGIVMRNLGTLPELKDLDEAVQRIVAIFKNIKSPSLKPLHGLFGELFLISRSKSPESVISAWRMDNAARFDFCIGDIRLEVKTSTARTRSHIFSFDQCNPPSGTIGAVASLQTEKIPSGCSIADLLSAIEAKVSNWELVLRLHETVAKTLGASLSESLNVCFDLHLAESSLEFFDIREIPAIRKPLDTGVSNVKFISDLSGANPLSIDELIGRDPGFRVLTPST